MQAVSWKVPTALLTSPDINTLELETPSSIFTRCNDLCTALIRDPEPRTSCQRLCDELKAHNEEPCIQALQNSTDEHLTLLSYSSGDYFETAGILAGAAREANPDYLSFIQHLRLHDRGSPEACHSIRDVHYCVVQDASMSLGLCLPDACDSASVSNIMANISTISSDSVSAILGDHVSGLKAEPSTIPLPNVVCGTESRLEVDAGTVLTLIFVAFIFAIPVVGTALDFQQRARLASSSQKHAIMSDTRSQENQLPPASAEQWREQRRDAAPASENASRASEGGAQRSASDEDQGMIQERISPTNDKTQADEHEQSSKNESGDTISPQHTMGGALGSDSTSLREPLLHSSRSSEPRRVRGVREGSSSSWAQCLLCFSLRKNFVKLFAPPSSTAFVLLDGIRLLSNLWVMLLHVSINSLAAGGGVTNAVDIYPLDGHGLLASIPAQVIHQATLAVDTFFLISGFLASVTLLPLLPRVQSGPRGLSSWVFGRYLHRYLRLLPTTAFITLVIWQLYPLSSDGPTWWPYASLVKDSCRKYWWTEVLFVMNFIPWPQPNVLCMAVSWTLGIEMQLFLGAVPMIVLYHYHPRVSVAFLAFVMAVSCFYTLWFGFYEDVRFPMMHMNVQSRSQVENWVEVYTSSWCRCPVYIMGMLFGMAWHTHFAGRSTSSGQQGPGSGAVGDFLAALDKHLVLLGFVTAALLMLLPVFGGYWANRDVGEVQVPAWADHLYLAFSRPAWTLGVALVCGLCLCGHGGAVNWFLTLPVWAPLSKLTFCSYLIHYPFVMMMYLSRSVPFRYTSYETLVSFWGVVGVSFFLSAAVHLWVEAPFRNLESWVRKRARNPSSS